MTETFKRVGLLGRFADPNVAQPVAVIADHLRHRGCQVLLGAHDDMPAELAAWDSVAEAELAAGVDLIVAVGGDGTMLHAARRVAGQQVPLLGVNRGRLGFLTDVSPDQMVATVDAVLSGDFVDESRLMLQAEIGTSGQPVGPMLALNDVVLQKWKTGHMLDFVSWVNGVYVNTHGGDGLIVATPTGSTAYALSCGGPIMEPDVDALVMVPICPHTLSDRPLVFRASSTITIEIDERLDTQALVTCDGEVLGEISPGEALTIRAADERVRLLHPVGHNYYELLRSKLNWGRTGRTAPEPSDR
jgi:NAD+ kinase